MSAETARNKIRGYKRKNRNRKPLANRIRSWAKSRPAVATVTTTQVGGRRFRFPFSNMSMPSSFGGGWWKKTSAGPVAPSPVPPPGPAPVPPGPRPGPGPAGAALANVIILNKRLRYYKKGINNKLSPKNKQIINALRRELPPGLLSGTKRFFGIGGKVPLSKLGLPPEITQDEIVSVLKNLGLNKSVNMSNRGGAPLAPVPGPSGAIVPVGPVMNKNQKTIRNARKAYYNKRASNASLTRNKITGNLTSNGINSALVRRLLVNNANNINKIANVLRNKNASAKFKLGNLRRNGTKKTNAGLVELLNHIGLSNRINRNKAGPVQPVPVPVVPGPGPAGGFVVTPEMNAAMKRKRVRRAFYNMRMTNNKMSKVSLNFPSLINDALALKGMTANQIASLTSNDRKNINKIAKVMKSIGFLSGGIGGIGAKKPRHTNFQMQNKPERLVELLKNLSLLNKVNLSNLKLEPKKIEKIIEVNKPSMSTRIRVNNNNNNNGNIGRLLFGRRISANRNYNRMFRERENNLERILNRQERARRMRELEEEERLTRPRYNITRGLRVNAGRRNNGGLGGLSGFGSGNNGRNRGGNNGGLGGLSGFGSGNNGGSRGGNMGSSTATMANNRGGNNTGRIGAPMMNTTTMNRVLQNSNFKQFSNASANANKKTTTTTKRRRIVRAKVLKDVVTEIRKKKLISQIKKLETPEDEIEKVTQKSKKKMIKYLIKRIRPYVKKRVTSAPAPSPRKNNANANRLSPRVNVPPPTNTTRTNVNVNRNLSLQPVLKENRPLVFKNVLLDTGARNGTRNQGLRPANAGNTRRNTGAFAP